MTESKPLTKEIYHEYTDTVICPYCGHDNGGDNGDGPPEGEQECYNDQCKMKFDCEPDFLVTYSTRKIPCMNGEQHEWGQVFWATEQGYRSCKGCRKSEWVNR